MILTFDKPTMQEIEHEMVEHLRFNGYFVEAIGDWLTPTELRARLRKLYGVDYSAPALSNLLARRKPPGIEIRWCMNRDAGTRRRIDLVRASPVFMDWLAAHIRHWRNKK